MLEPGRVYNQSTYRYAMNGQEKSFEIDTSGNLTDAKFWEYDSRIGRRWNLDPITRVSESPYGTFSENPILYNDVLGNSAQPVIDEKNKTIALNANIYLSGKVSQKKLNQIWAKATKSFNEQLNSKSFKASYKGEEYTITFNVKIFTLSEDEADKMVNSNQSIANNFITVMDDNRTSYSALGKNEAVWTTGDILGKNSNPTTVVHEFFHSLGLTHPDYEESLFNSGVTTDPNTGVSTISPPSTSPGYHPTSRIINPRYSNYLAPPANYVSPNAKPILKQTTGFERSVQQADIDDAINLMQSNPYKIRHTLIKTYDPYADFLQYNSNQ